MAEAYVNLPKKLMEKIQNLQTSAPNIAARVLGAGVGAAEERMRIEYAKAANKGYGTGYTLSKIRTRPTNSSTSEHPQIFIGVIDETAAARMKWIEGGRVRYSQSKMRVVRLQSKRPFMGKVRKFIRSRECKKLMEDRFKKIIDSL